ncbi:glycosyltransferase family 4 protein [Candidatus Woesearchaeota archaeon]|jgi:teichuronic acid biosynthesis glycosyltransferase TuaC|nr:glycosyltransferase family 4 protein [Candidatus Woesearchaeota archaeon]
MNICLINPSFFPMHGGAEQLTYDVAKQLSKDHKIIIATTQLEGTKKAEYIDNLKVYRSKTSKIPFLSFILNQIYFHNMLKKVIKKEKIDILHQFHLFNLGGAVILAKKNKKLITSLIGWDTYDPIRPVPKYLHKYMAWIMNGSDKLITSSKHMYSSAKKQGCKKEIKIIPHGVNSQKAKSIDIRKKYNIKKNDKIIFSLQRLHERKGLKYLILAASKIKYKNIKFIIGGKGPELNNLKKLTRKLKLEDKIKFLGYIPEEDMINFYKKSDLFVLPSLYEGFGIVYIDALINGLPIVTTKCGGSEVMVNDSNGIMVKPKDSEQLANAIAKALNKKWNKDKIKKDAKKYKWENVIKEYHKVYNELF